MIRQLQPLLVIHSGGQSYKSQNMASKKATDQNITKPKVSDLDLKIKNIPVVLANSGSVGISFWLTCYVSL